MRLLMKLIQKAAPRSITPATLHRYLVSCPSNSAFRKECSAAARILERSGIYIPRSLSAHEQILKTQSLLLFSRPLQSAAASDTIILANGLRPNHRGPHGGIGSDDYDHGPGGGPQNDDDKNRWKSALLTATAYLFIIGLVYLFPSTEEQEQPLRYVSWYSFIHHMLARGEVEKVTVRPGVNVVSIHLHEGAIIKGKKAEQRIYFMNILDIERFEEKLREAEASLGLTGSQCVPVEYNRLSDTASKLIGVLFLLGMIILYKMSMSKINVRLSDGFRNLRKAKFTTVDPKLPGSGKGVRFSDVAGAKEAKQEVMEIVDFLKNPDKYTTLGAKFPKGALLLGPPGCGKTLLAKAVATEGQVPFLAMNGPEFNEMIGGLGAARVRDLFVEAKKRAPCIIYVDEIDAIGKKRSESTGQMDGSSDIEQTLNQLLVEMDGIGSKVGVMMLGSTNRLDMLDKALLRPGRFDRHIVLDLPTQQDRAEILVHYMKELPLEESKEVLSKRLAVLTLGFSGAELANVVNEAALFAARNARDKVTRGDFEYAVERVIGGAEKKSATVSLEERRIVAYHEAGHALVGWMLEHTDALLKVTIVPRTSHALGFAQYQPLERKLYTKEQLFERMCMAMGGRVAESLVFNRITTGAQDDLRRVTKLAYAQVRNFGFNEKVGLVSFNEPDEGARFVGLRPYSDHLTHIIDDEANKLIFEAYKHTESVIKQNMDKLKMLAETLLKEETVSYSTVEELWGPPPHGPKVNIDPLQFEGEVKSWADAGKLYPEP